MLFLFLFLLDWCKLFKCFIIDLYMNVMLRLYARTSVVPFHRNFRITGSNETGKLLEFLLSAPLSSHYQD